MQKSSYALTPHTGRQLSPLLPEASLLTGSDKTFFFILEGLLNSLRVMSRLCAVGRYASDSRQKKREMGGFEFAFKVGLNLYHRSLPRRLGTFVLIQKCPKNQVSRNASLPHGPFTHKARKPARAGIFSADYPIALRPCIRKVPMPEPTSQACRFPRFCPKLLC